MRTRTRIIAVTRADATDHPDIDERDPMAVRLEPRMPNPAIAAMTTTCDCAWSLAAAQPKRTSRLISL